MSSFLRVAVLVIFACAGCGAALATAPYPNSSYFGVPFTADEDWYKQCMRVATLRAPAVNGVPAPKPDCHAEDLYYIKRGQSRTSSAEWAGVRACAVARDDSAVLMMVYANGLGVARDADMALHYACSLDHVAKAEMEARVSHLVAKERSPAPVDQCDDITSGYMGAICASIRERNSQRVRNARLDRLARTFAPAVRAAFARLREAAERFATEAAGEVDRRGTASLGFTIEREGQERELFMQAALDAAGGKLVPASAADFAASDAELNARYQNVMTAASADKEQPDRIEDTTITRTAVRSAQRAWLVYRDAFAAFVTTLPAGPDAVTIKAQLTRTRSAEFSASAKY